MNYEQLVVLDEDKKYAKDRIKELEEEILALGPEFYEAFNQTSETWHDNAPFEAVRDKQSVMNAEIHKLRRVLRSSTISVPRQSKGKVGIGSIVLVKDTETNTEKTYFIAGDWTPFAGNKYKDTNATIISRKSPIGAKIINLKERAIFTFRNHEYMIVSINNIIL